MVRPGINPGPLTYESGSLPTALAAWLMGLEDAKWQTVENLIRLLLQEQTAIVILINPMGALHFMTGGVILINQLLPKSLLFINNFYVNGSNFQGETLLYIASFLSRGPLLKQRICSYRSKFFVLRVDIISRSHAQPKNHNGVHASYYNIIFGKGGGEFIRARAFIRINMVGALEGATNT